MGAVSKEDREAWKAASDRLACVDAERAVVLRPTNAEHAAALEALALVEERLGEPWCVCEACANPVFPGEPYLGGDTPLCGECAPTYAVLLTEPESFVNDDGDPMSPLEARAEYDKHISAGGQATDSMATVR